MMAAGRGLVRELRFGFVEETLHLDRLLIVGVGV